MGEHAVVYGHPALVAAIDLRLRVTVESAPTGGVVLDLPQVHSTIETSWGEILDRTNDARVAWRRQVIRSDERPPKVRPMPPGELVLLALGQTARHVGGAPDLGLRLRLDSQLPIGSGLGSSAAVAVAVPAAMLSLLDEPTDEETLETLSLAIERYQHGLPSGIDNRAVLTGGLLWAQHEHRSGELACSVLGCEPWWLDDLQVYHSGTPAESTGEVVTTVRQRLGEYPARYQKLLMEIDSTTKGLRETVTGRRDLEQVMTLVRRCERALEELGVVPEPTAAIIRKIESAGGAAKISGAGALSGRGAGSVLIVAPDPGAVDGWSFLNGWRRLPVNLPADGLRLEEGP
jgi:mevalonate kinase